LSHSLIHPANLLLLALAVVSAHLCVHYIAQWSGRRGQRLSLWIAAWSGLAAVHIVGRLIHWTAVTDERAVLGMTIAEIAVCGGLVVVLGAAFALADRKPPRFLLEGVGVVSAALIALHLATPWFFTGASEVWRGAFGRELLWVEPGWLAPIWGPLGSAVLVTALVVVGRSTRSEPMVRRGFVAALGVYLVAGVHDLALAWFPMDRILWFDFSFAVVAIGLDHLSVRITNDAWEHLEERVVERTAELEHANVALRAAVEEAARSAEAKTRFLANVSHEIRTPMSGILGMSRQLLRSTLDAGQRQLAETVHRSSVTLITVLDDILDAARIEHGTWRVDIQPFAPHRILEDVCELLAIDADARDLELVCRLPTDRRLSVLGDPDRFRQVVLNLVGNGLRYTDRGDVVVELSVERPAGSPAVARVEVRDTGPGIEAGELGRLFEPFTQSELDEGRGGTGLGLSIARGLVELMGGRIGADSRPGVGSTFWFELPMAEDDLDSSLVTAGLPGTRVLVVEHRTATRRALEATLRDWGAEVIATDLAVGARHHARTAAARGRPFDVVLVDVDLPDDAFSLADALAGLGSDRSAPVYALVGAAGGGARVEREFTGVLVRPVRQGRLFAAVSARRRPAAAGLVEETALPGPLGDIPIVLVVDDDEVNRSLATMQLTQLGFDVRVARSGAEALELQGDERYAAVLMDCRMPGLDGYETARRWRESEAGRERRTPIIAMTAHAMERERRRSLDAGMDDHLTKPVLTEDLGDCLRMWLRVAAEPGDSLPSA